MSIFCHIKKKLKSADVFVLTNMSKYAYLRCHRLYGEIRSFLDKYTLTIHNTNANPLPPCTLRNYWMSLLYFPIFPCCLLTKIRRYYQSQMHIIIINIWWCLNVINSINCLTTEVRSHYFSLKKLFFTVIFPFKRYLWKKSFPIVFVVIIPL